MPIQGLTQVRRLTRLRKIRMGIKVKSKSNPNMEIPQKSDHFVVPPEVEKVMDRSPKFSTS
jgi:hypothetical protein